MHNIKRPLALLAVLLFALVASPAQAQHAAAPITVVDDTGTTITLAAPAQRIVALAPNITEILFSLGLGTRVVGVSDYSDYPAQAKHLPIVITNGEPAIEKILSLRPDLVISADIVPEQVVLKLRSLHLNVLQTNPHDIPGIFKDILLVGKVAGVSSFAARQVAGLQSRIAAVEARVKHVATHPSVFYELDNTYYTVGRGSFIDTLITMAGGVNIAGAIANPYPQLSAEKILTADPQVIILADAAYGVTRAQVEARPGWSLISAVKTHRIYPFDADIGSRPGPRVVLALEDLAKILHPEAFK